MEIRNYRIYQRKTTMGGTIIRIVLSSRWNFVSRFVLSLSQFTRRYDKDAISQAVFKARGGDFVSCVSEAGRNSPSAEWAHI